VVAILGKLTAKDWNTGKEDRLWFFWEAQATPTWNAAMPLRRGWSEAREFILASGRTETDVPEIAPPAK
jgi:hypothetical protein